MRALTRTSAALLLVALSFVAVCAQASPDGLGLVRLVPVSPGGALAHPSAALGFGSNNISQSHGGLSTSFDRLRHQGAVILDLERFSGQNINAETIVLVHDGAGRPDRITYSPGKIEVGAGNAAKYVTYTQGLTHTIRDRLSAQARLLEWPSDSGSIRLTDDLVSAEFGEELRVSFPSPADSLAVASAGDLLIDGEFRSAVAKRFDFASANGNVDYRARVSVPRGVVSLRAPEGQTILRPASAIDVSFSSKSGRGREGKQSAGGELHVGGRDIFVASAARLTADSDAGDGGKIVVFAARCLYYAGKASASSTAAGGKGGFIETSAVERFAFPSGAQAKAVPGGTWLIDPANVRIDDAENVDGSFVGDPGEPLTWVATGTNSVLNASLLEEHIEEGMDIIVSTTTGIAGSGDIRLVTAIEATHPGPGEGLLSFVASRDVIFDADASVTLTNVKLELHPTRHLSMSGTTLKTIDTGSSAVEIITSASSGASAVTLPSITASSLVVQCRTGISLQSGTGINPKLTIQGTSQFALSVANNPIVLGSSGNRQNLNGAVTVTAPGTSSSVAVYNTPNLAFASFTASTLTAVSSGSISGASVSSAVSGAATLTVASTGSITLNTANINFGGTVTVSAASSVSLRDINAITVATSGTVGTLAVQSGGLMTLSGVTVSGTATLNAGSNGITVSGTSNFGTLAIPAAGAVSVTEASSTHLASVSASQLTIANTGDLTNTATASIQVTNRFDIAVAGTVALGTGAGDTLNAGQFRVIGGSIASVSLSENSNTVIEQLSLPAGSCSLQTTGTLAQTGAIVVGQAFSATAQGAVTLTHASNDFGASVSLAGTGAVSLRHGGGGDLQLGAVTVQSGTLTLDADGDIAQTSTGALSGCCAIRKLGASALVLSRENLGFEGELEVQEGQLVVAGGGAVLHPNETHVILRAGTAIRGDGTVGALTAENAEVRPGTDAAPGTLVAGGGFVMDAGRLVVRLAGAGSFDSVAVLRGNVTLESSPQLNVTVVTAPSNADVFLLVDNRGEHPVRGTFAGLPEGPIDGGIAGIAVASISYEAGEGGNDVALSFVPPPKGGGSSDDGLGAGPIAGIAVGGVAALVLLLVAGAALGFVLFKIVLPRTRLRNKIGKEWWNDSV